MRSTLAKLSLCRTAALGGHLYECESCDRRAVVYNSCGDRHCPQCGGAKRRDWLDSTSGLLLPGVDYYQVVFTIPDGLSSLALGNRRALFNLLFQTAWRSLKRVIERERGFEPAAAMVLHTWNQKLESHAHVHALVPGGGPSLSGPSQTGPGTWKPSAPPPGRANRFWLVDADALRAAFRTEFLKGLRGLHRRGKLKLEGTWSHLQSASAFDSWLAPLERVSWVTFIQPPPSKHSSPAHVLKYLARYMTGGPVSDRRLTAHADGHVTFTARAGTQTGGGDETEQVTLSGAEFVRRWSLHILPKGFTKTRRFGGYSNYHRQRYLQECREQLSADVDAVDDVDDAAAAVDGVSAALALASDECSEDSDRSADPRCPHCDAPLRCVSQAPAPSWRDVMHGRFRPHWYDDG